MDFQYHPATQLQLWVFSLSPSVFAQGLRRKPKTSFFGGGCRGHQSSASKFSQMMLRNSFGVVGASSGETFVSPILTIEVAEGEPRFKKVLG